MNKEKEIEEMVEIARKHGQKIYKETEMYADIYDDMTAVYEAGYRKAEDVRKETAKDILQELYPYIGHWLTFKALKEKYGIEVDE